MDPTQARPAPPPAEPWAAVVAHYDARGALTPDLMATVQALHGHGLRVCFVSTGLGDAEAAALAPFAQVIRRENTGYDFWSYKVGIDHLLPQGPWRRLLLLNSSVWIDDVGRILGRMQAVRGHFDLLALTMSHEAQPHLQSYWLAFESPQILASEAFAGWWGGLQPYSERAQVIAQHELGLSAHFLRAGFRLGALFKPGREHRLRAVLRALDNGRLALPAADPVLVDPAAADGLNPTLYAWDGLLGQLGVLKWELLRRTPPLINLEPLRRDPRLAPLLGP